MGRERWDQLNPFHLSTGERFGVNCFYHFLLFLPGRSAWQLRIRDDYKDTCTNGNESNEVELTVLL